MEVKKYHNLLKTIGAFSMIDAYKSFDSNMLYNHSKDIRKSLSDIKKARSRYQKMLDKTLNANDKRLTKATVILKKELNILNNQHMGQVIEYHNTLNIAVQFAQIGKTLDLSEDIEDIDFKITKKYFGESLISNIKGLELSEEYIDTFKTFNYYRNLFAHKDGQVIFRKMKISELDELDEFFKNLKFITQAFENTYMQSIRKLKNVFSLIILDGIIEDSDGFKVQIGTKEFDNGSQVDNINEERFSLGNMEIMSKNTDLSPKEFELKMRDIQKRSDEGKFDKVEDYLVAFLSIMSSGNEKATNILETMTEHDKSQLIKQLSQKELY